MNIRQAKFRFPLVDILRYYKHTVYEKGADFVCCCPFHHERTPSFHIYVKDREYHCFGCGMHGDVIGFVQEIEQLETVSEALKFLSDLEASRQDPGSNCKSKSYDELLKENADLKRKLRTQSRPRVTRDDQAPDTDLEEWEFLN